MDNVISWVILIGSLVTAITAICAFCKKIINKGFEPIYKKIDEQKEEINHRLDKLDINQCRNFLVNFLSDIEKGEEVNEIRVKRAYEVYDHYCELGGNSYIHDKWEKLMKKKE